MTNEYNQANPDGTLVVDDEPVLQPARVKEIVKGALANSNWSINWTLEERAQLQGTMSNGEGETFNLNIYCKPLSNTGRTSPNDKRIQLKDLEIVDDEQTINLLLGVYERNQNAIIVGWNINAYSEPGKNHSAKIHVKKVAQAMRDGFSTFKISTEKKRNSYAFRPNFLLSYMLNLDNFYENDFDENANTGNEEQTQQLNFEPNEIPSEFPRNLIVYGAPGTGKSHELDSVATELFPDNYLRKRITFYPKYSYSQFAGVYKPTPIYKEATSRVYDASMVREADYQYEPLIDYKFEIGPFLEMLCRAIDNPGHNFILIIEEINRANAASVFGDFFSIIR
ncbi:ATP-binding protein [Bacillus carboniphilus]|uniref:ATP-binding protein n=1 Tax=Bacillus carboniphilus TaxID=86663 RepID=A0ABY9JVZ4_9BACI|nr:ATP-binding protein [Bacillus carboniphilus]WLR41851.1 ATP-binding protein [Bacillus carboniphilus]